MKNRERWGKVFVFIATTLAMAVLGSWLMWVYETERWHLLAGYYVVIAFLIGKLWDYRPPPL